jgi:hypothetical protein
VLLRLTVVEPLPKVAERQPLAAALPQVWAESLQREAALLPQVSARPP